MSIPTLPYHLHRLGLILIVLLCTLSTSAQVATDTTNADSMLVNQLNDSLKVLSDTSNTATTTTDTTNPTDSNNAVTASSVDTSFLKKIQPNMVNAIFSQDSVELQKGQILTNVLYIINKTEETHRFIIDLMYPGVWTSLMEDSVYTIAPDEQIIVPVILIPNKSINGNTEIMINAFLMDENENQLGFGYFSLYTQKQISWEANISPSDRMYFRNGEFEKSFEYTIANTGNYTQDILLSYYSSTKDLVLKDTNDFILKDQASTVRLLPGRDTTITFNAETSKYKERNFRKVSVYTHNPNANLNYKKHTMYIHSTEPKGVGTSTYSKTNKVDLIKLPNSTKASPFGYPNLPLIVEANVQNILSDYTFMTINMRGFKQLDQDASLAYFAQINYSSTYFSTNAYRSIPWYVGYYDKRKTIELGQISGNLVGVYNAGQGIKASYKYFGGHKTEAFYVRAPSAFQAPRTESYGIGHSYTMDTGLKVAAKLGRGINYATNTTVDVFQFNPSFNFNKKHFFNLIGAVSSRNTGNPFGPQAVLGYLIGGNYSVNYYDGKAKTTIGGRYNDPQFSYGNFERISGNHRTQVTLSERWDVFFNNIYQKLENFGGIGFNQEMLFNNAVLSTVNKFGTFQPGLYYNMTDLLNNRIHSRGLSFRYSNFNFDKNVLTSFFVKAGYNDPIDFQTTPDYFTLEVSSLLRYRTWNFIGKYSYGALSGNAFENMLAEGITPQAVRLSLQHQHQFKNSHFIMENAVRYNYHNRFNGHNFSINPQIFYFTNSLWRFGVQANYALSSSNYADLYDTYGVNQGNIERGASVNQNLQIGVNVLKEFGIPVPFAKAKHASNEIIAFYDVNGNGIREQDEPVMENVIIRMGLHEVITNADGFAEIENMPMGVYPLTVIALDKMVGWFPDVMDSVSVIGNTTLYVPFVRGVRVYGDVVVDRQDIAVADQDKLFDLSNIKITAVNGKTYTTLTNIDGHFELYLPNGTYVITMDETILGETFTISRNNIPLELRTEQDGVYISFYVLEKRRKVKFKEF